jgi:HAD superfamily hydrolase (TIGR01509 family)
MDLVLTGTGKSVLEALFEGSPFAEAAREYQLQLPATIFLDLVKPEPHVHEVLRQVRTGGCRTAVATNRGKSLVPLLEMLGMRDLFDILVSSNDVTRNKPDPECLLIILKRFGLAPDEALYVGDSDIDRETAARAGTPFAAYRNPSLKADHHLRAHTDLLEVLDVDLNLPAQEL